MRPHRLTALAVGAAVLFAGLVAAVSTSDPSSAAGPTRIGMSAPADQWDARLAEVGSVDARRIFGQLDSPTRLVALARSEVAAGRLPILSVKVPGNDWAGAAAGRYDVQLRALVADLDAIPGPVFLAVHHEPAGDGTATAYAAMQRHLLPIITPPDNVDGGPIVNGFWWSAQGQGLSDAEIAAWLPADVLRLAEVVAADTYQGGTTADPGEGAGVKITRLSAWATRVGVTRLGIGEYNGLSAATITAAGDAVLADPRFVFAAIFNSNENNRDGVSWQLTGDRLAAFKAIVAKARAQQPPPTTTAPPSTSSTTTTTTTTTTLAPTTTQAATTTTTTLPPTTTTTVAPTTTTTLPPTTTTTVAPTTTTTVLLGRCTAVWAPDGGDARITADKPSVPLSACQLG